MWNKNFAVHLRSSASLRAVLLACIAGAAPFVGAAQISNTMAETVASPPSAASASVSLPAPAAIRAAAAKLRMDPNLGSDHTVRSLHWVDNGAPPPESPAWMLGLFEYIGQAASVVLWIIGGIAAAVAVVWIYRLIRARSPRSQVAHALTTSHVSGLDIRPASLPDDVGAAALALLQAGRTRDALSLLYRGALSRAVHRFGVIIRESFTEGEALRAVQSRLDRPRAEYFRDLVALWQRAVYAGQTPSTEPVAALCANFSTTLGGAP